MNEAVAFSAVCGLKLYRYSYSLIKKTTVLTASTVPAALTVHGNAASINTALTA